MRTDVLVTNDLTVRFPPRRKPLLYVQTWHGTPLKRIGWDASTGTFALSDWYLRKQDEDVERWDLLISPSPEITGILRKAFRYSGPVLECGYPRNDVLLADDLDQRRLLVRKRLGVPDGARTVLYAPTWRASSRQRDRPSDGHPLLDPDFVEGLPADIVVLARLHPLEGGSGASRQSGTRILDLSDHPDVRDLLVVADVLVTDYSSLMFDFALTERAMVFFAHDLEHYRDRERGFYFDYEATVPGPIVSTPAALRDALVAALEGQLTDTERAAAFRRRFCAHDDGRATGRLVERIMGSLL